MLKKILNFLGICACGVGAIGGIGYALYCKAYVIALAIVVLAVYAFPAVKKAFKEIMG